MSEVRIPLVLRHLTGDVSQIKVSDDAETIADVLEDLEQQYPGFKQHLLTEDGELARCVNVYLGPDDIRFLGGLATAVDQDVSIIPTLHGGA